METGAYGQGASSLSYGPLVYGYANARVRAMRPHLIARRQAEDMLKVKTNAAVAEYLSRTAYRDDFANMPAKISDEDRVELAVSRNFARTAEKLLRITPKASVGALRAFLTRYDVHNMKTILLGKKLGKDRLETERLLIPAGTMSRAELAAMLSAKSSEEFYTALRATGFGAKFLVSASVRPIPKPQLKAMLQGGDGSRIDWLLTALDSYYFEAAASGIPASEKDAPTIIALLRSEADAKNIMTAMRLVQSKAEKGEVMRAMVLGGHMSKAQLGKMASAKGVSEIAALAGQFFTSETGRGEFAAAGKLFKEDGQLSHFEVVFENSVARRSLHALRRSQMSIGSIVGFLLLKEEEMGNIRKIVRGKALGLPIERTAEMLVFVN